MVLISYAPPIPDCDFQYSLCRVVLMVAMSAERKPSFFKLSVLALSSRFDGLCTAQS